MTVLVRLVRSVYLDTHYPYSLTATTRRSSDASQTLPKIRSRRLPLHRSITFLLRGSCHLNLMRKRRILNVSKHTENLKTDFLLTRNKPLRCYRARSATEYQCTDYEHRYYTGRIPVSYHRAPSLAAAAAAATDYR